MTDHTPTAWESKAVGVAALTIITLRLSPPSHRHSASLIDSCMDQHQMDAPRIQRSWCAEDRYSLLDHYPRFRRSWRRSQIGPGPQGQLPRPLQGSYKQRIQPVQRSRQHHLFLRRLQQLVQLDQ